MSTRSVFLKHFTERERAELKRGIEFMIARSTLCGILLGGASALLFSALMATLPRWPELGAFVITWAFIYFGTSAIRVIVLVSATRLKGEGEQ